MSNDSMMAYEQGKAAGESLRELFERLQREEVNNG